MGAALKTYFLPAILLVLSPPAAADADELTPFGTALEAAGFGKIAEDQGVTVYQDKEARSVRVAAEGEFDGPPEEVLKALLSFERQQRVIKRLSQSWILERGPDSLVVYQHLNLPVVSDRDYVLNVRWGGDGTARWVSFHAVRQQGPAPRDGIVRVTDHEGSWQLRPLRGGKATLVRFQMTLDVAGDIPRWLVRIHAGQEVLDLFASVRKLFASAEYGGSAAGPSCVQDPRICDRSPRSARTAG